MNELENKTIIPEIDKKFHPWLDDPKNIKLGCLYRSGRTSKPYEKMFPDEIDGCIPCDGRLLPVPKVIIECNNETN